MAIRFRRKRAGSPHAYLDRMGCAHATMHAQFSDNNNDSEEIDTHEDIYSTSTSKNILRTCTA